MMGLKNAFSTVFNAIEAVAARHIVKLLVFTGSLVILALLLNAPPSFAQNVTQFDGSYTGFAWSNSGDKNRIDLEVANGIITVTYPTTGGVGSINSNGDARFTLPELGDLQNGPYIFQSYGNGISYGTFGTGNVPLQGGRERDSGYWNVVETCNDSIPGYLPSDNGFIFPNDDAMWPPSDYINYNTADYVDLLLYCSEFGVKLSPSDFPSWDRFADAFGSNAVYDYIGTNRYFKTRALDSWTKHMLPQSTGSCYGFSLASLLHFADPTEIPSSYFNDATAADPYCRDTINKYYTYQFSQEGLQYGPVAGSFGNVNVGAEVDAIKQNLSLDASQYRMVSIYHWNKDGNIDGAHTMVPYKITCNPTIPGEDSIFVYDCNHPKTDNLFILANNVLNNWSYEPLSWDEVGYGLYADAEAGTFAGVPTLKTFHKGMQIASVPNDSLPSSVYFGDSALVSVQDAFGHELNTQDSLQGNFPGASYVIPRTGGQSRIIGFNLPAASSQEYFIDYNPFQSDSENYVDISNSNTIMRPHFSEHDSSTVRFHADLNNELLAVHATSNNNDFGYSMVTDDSISEKVISIFNSSLEANDSVSFQMLQLQDSVFRINNFGTAKKYDLNFHRVSPTTYGTATFNQIPIGANESHTFTLGSWDSLNMTKITIQVDNGNKGTIDTVIILQNATSGVNENSAVSNTSQIECYPNPITSSAKIAFSTSESGVAEVSIFNVLGAEVARLYEGELDAGQHSFIWDASGAAAGMYACLVRVNGNVQRVRLAHVI